MKRTALKRKRFYPKRKTPFATRNTPTKVSAGIKTFNNTTGSNSRRKSNKKYDWSYWAMKSWGRFTTAYNFDSYITCMKPGCNRIKGLVADHVYPRSGFRHDPWNPCNSQILCWEHNGEKGSSHGPQWDYRSWKYKVFQRCLRRRDWTYNTVTRKWEMNSTRAFRPL